MYKLIIIFTGLITFISAENKYNINNDNVDEISGLNKVEEFRNDKCIKHSYHICKSPELCLLYYFNNNYDTQYIIVNEKCTTNYKKENCEDNIFDKSNLCISTAIDECIYVYPGSTTTELTTHYNFDKILSNIESDVYIDNMILNEQRLSKKEYYKTVNNDDNYTAKNYSIIGKIVLYLYLMVFLYIIMWIITALTLMLTIILTGRDIKLMIL